MCLYSQLVVGVQYSGSEDLTCPTWKHTQDFKDVQNNQQGNCSSPRTAPNTLVISNHKVHLQLKLKFQSWHKLEKVRLLQNVSKF